MDLPIVLLSRLTPAGARAIETARSASAAAELSAKGLLDLPGLHEWDRILLLARAEVIGSNRLRAYVDSVIGPHPCCADCADKDTPEKRGRTRSALNMLARHLRDGQNRFHPERTAAAMDRLRRVLDTVDEPA